MAEWPSGTVTFLFTDLEGSTQRWQQYPAAMGPALARHDRLVRDAISAHGGVVFKTVGDAVCAAFATAPTAVAAALTAERALYGEPWGTTGPLRARMALHTGQAEAQAGDYLGSPLNRVARLLSAGHGGQILLSGPTADLVNDYLPPGVTLRDLGTHRLKDVLRPEHIFQLVAPDLPAEFAPLATVGPASAQTDPATTTPVAGKHRPNRRRQVVVAATTVVLAAALVGALAKGWMGAGDVDQRVETPVVAFVATSRPTITSVPLPTATAAPPVDLSSSNAIGAAAHGSGQVVYTVYDGQPGSRHVYRVGTWAGATPEDISTDLDTRSTEASDLWIAIAPDGARLTVGTERFDSECVGWPCLMVMPADLSSADLVQVDGEVVHPGGLGAIAGDIIVFPSGEGPHETDLWAIRQQDAGWGAPLLLTGESSYAYHAEPALTLDGSRVAFECGDRPYGEEGTALCEVGTDGSGFRVVLTPTDAAADLSATAALRHPGYAPDGAIFFEASWDAAIWRLSAGATSAESVGGGFDNDGAPCVLPDGRIASLWLDRPGSEGLHELKVMTADGVAYVMLVTGIDIAQISCGG